MAPIEMGVTMDILGGRNIGLATLAFTTCFAALPAFASCNSGSTAKPYLVSDSNCQADASGLDSTAVGDGASATKNFATAFGDFAVARSEGATVIGQAAGYFGSGLNSVAVGNAATSQGDYSIAIGGQNDDAYVIANGTYAIAIGVASTAPGINSIAVGGYAGYNPGANNDYSTALGAGAGRDSKGQGYTAIGLASGQQVTGDLNTAIGNSAGQIVTGGHNLSVGVSTGQNVTGSLNLAVGDIAGSQVTGNYNIAIGPGAGDKITTSNTVAIGRNAHATKNGAIAIGHSSVAAIADTVSFGSSDHTRRLMNVAKAEAATDAVNLKQVKSLIRKAMSPKSESDESDDSDSAASGGAVVPANASSVIHPKSGAMAPPNASVTETTGCHDGDIAGNWSMSATGVAGGGASIMWCDVQFSRSGAAKYRVAGNCRSHSPDEATAQTFAISGNQSVAVSSSCKISGTFVLQQGNHSITATIIEGQVESAGNQKTRATGITRWPRGNKFALQTFVMQR